MEQSNLPMIGESEITFRVGIPKHQMDSFQKVIDTVLKALKPLDPTAHLVSANLFLGREGWEFKFKASILQYFKDADSARQVFVAMYQLALEPKKGQ